MNNSVFWFELLQFLGFGSAFAFGLIKFFKNKVALYFKIITCSLGCYALGKLYTIVNLLCFGKIPDEFHVGYLGLFGCFIFLLSANYGQINGLLDDKSKELRKHRLLSLIVPAILTALLIMMMFSCNTLKQRLILLVLIPSIFATYYGIKVLIFPDMGFEFLHVIKLCNIFLILFYVTVFSQIWADFKGYDTFKTSFDVFASFLAWLIILAAYKGGKSWKI